jgi:hypothetical protein
MATGRGRAILAYGWSHFLCYGGAVLLVVPLGIKAVAVAAATVHTAFVLVAYVMLLHDRAGGRAGQIRAAGKVLLADVVPASMSCLALAAVAVPVSIGLSDAHVSALLYLATVGLAGLAAYIVALRGLFPASFHAAREIIAHVLPKPPWPRLPGRVATASAGSGTP